MLRSELLCIRESSASQKEVRTHAVIDRLYVVIAQKNADVLTPTAAGLSIGLAKAREADSSEHVALCPHRLIGLPARHGHMRKRMVPCFDWVRRRC